MGPRPCGFLTTPRPAGGEMIYLSRGNIWPKGRMFQGLREERNLGRLLDIWVPESLTLICGEGDGNPL